MEKLANPKNTKEIVQKYEFSFRKKLGQNFLIDPSVPERIVETAQITKDDCVVEIGPGIGTLTQYLAEAAGKVVAVEVDRMLIPILEETLDGYGNVTVIHGDILKTDLGAVAREHNGGRPLKIAANLPYYITTPIIMDLLTKRVPVSSMTVMVQREVGERMIAGPGTKDYGALSLAVQYYTEPKMAFPVPPSCFMPRPKVESTVMHLACREKPPVEVPDEELLFAVIRAAFGQRRKTLVNSLANAPSLSFTKEQTAEAVLRMGLSPTVRGEALTLRQFGELSGLLGEYR